MPSSRNTTLRYLRHIDLPAIGFAGQEKIMAGRLALVGMGGLGAPAALYLAGAGVGHLTLIDHDAVEESNLQRQVLYTMADIGKPKAQCARAHLLELNPNLDITAEVVRLDEKNAGQLLHDADCVLDCSDNFATRFLLNDTCMAIRKPLITASVQGFAGQVAAFAPHKNHRQACARCLFPETPPEGMVPTCPEAGVFGPVVGIMGVMQAALALKELAGLETGQEALLTRFDLLTMRSEQLKVPKDPECSACGTGLQQERKKLQSAAS